MNARELSRLGRLAKEGSWVVLGHITAVAGALVFVRVLTEYLAPVQYGQLALGLTIASLVNQVMIGGVAAGIGRFYSVAAERQDFGGYMRATRHLLAYVTVVIVGFGLILLASLMWLGYSRWMGLAATAVVFSLFSGYSRTLGSIQNAARQRAIVAFHGGLDAWLIILLAVGFIVWLGTSSTAVMIGYACSSLLVTISQLLFLRRTIPTQRTQNAEYQLWMNKIWVYSWPMAAGGLFNWGYFASQRWALELFSTTEDLGRFYALTQIAYSPISMAGALSMSFLIPILFARAGEAKDEDRLRRTHLIVRRVAVTGFVFTVIIAMISYFFHSAIFGLFVSIEYRDISAKMPYVILAAGFLQVSIALASSAMVVNKTKLFLPLSIFGNFFLALINLLSTRKWGVDGLVISMAVGAFLHLTWMTLIIRQLHRSGGTWD